MARRNTTIYDRASLIAGAGAKFDEVIGPGKNALMMLNT